MEEAETILSGPASATGAVLGSGNTVIVTVSADDINLPSLAVRLNTYVPSLVNVISGFHVFLFENVAVAGPLVCVHVGVTVEPVGKPSSVYEPLSTAFEGSVIVLSAPASTTGALLGSGNTVIVTVSSFELSAPSLAIRLNT